MTTDLEHVAEYVCERETIMSIQVSGVYCLPIPIFCCCFLFTKDEARSVFLNMIYTQSNFIVSSSFLS